MDVSVHLVSAPWSRPDNTSMQLGALHAYVDKVFAGAVSVQSYSAFLGIPYRAAGSGLFDFYERVSEVGEHAYMALFLEQHWHELTSRHERFRVDALLRSLEATRSRGGVPLTRAMLRRLRRATEAYVDEEMAPSFERRAINLIGFSLNYDQVYASSYMARYIQARYAEFNPTFLFGGYSTSVPHVVALFHRLNVPGCLVIGEGDQ
jgi:hypothetical protein